MITPLKKSIASAITVGLLASSLPALAAKLKVQTSSNASHFSLAYLNENWVPELKKRTQGRWEIEFLPIKAVVPHRDTPKAVANGILDGDLTSTSYFSGLDPAFALIGDLIAGYDTPQQIQDGSSRQRRSCDSRRQATGSCNGFQIIPGEIPHSSHV